MLHARQIAPAFHALMHFCLSFLYFSATQFHNYNCLFHQYFGETPHTCSVSCIKLFVKESKSLSTLIIFATVLVFILSTNPCENSTCFSRTRSFHTFMLDTDLHFGGGRMETYKSSSTRLCFDAHPWLIVT